MGQLSTRILLQQIYEGLAFAFFSFCVLRQRELQKRFKRRSHLKQRKVQILFFFKWTCGPICFNGNPIKVETNVLRTSKQNINLHIKTGNCGLRPTYSIDIHQEFNVRNNCRRIAASRRQFSLTLSFTECTGQTSKLLGTSTQLQWSATVLGF